MKTVSSLTSYYFGSWSLFAQVGHNCSYFASSLVSDTNGLQHMSSRCSWQYLSSVPRGP